MFVRSLLGPAFVLVDIFFRDQIHWDQHQGLFGFFAVENVVAAVPFQDIVSRQTNKRVIARSTDQMVAVHDAIATVMGLLPEQVNIFVQAVTQEEVDLHFGVYERMLAEKLGAVPPIQ